MLRKLFKGGNYLRAETICGNTGVMKLRYRESIGAHPSAYILISTFTWFGSLYFFLNKSASWIKTPAESRHLNQDCKLLDFYDNHIWHFLSAASLFLSYMILLMLGVIWKHTKRRNFCFFICHKNGPNLFYNL